MVLNTAAIQLLADLQQAGSCAQLANNRQVTIENIFHSLVELDSVDPGYYLELDVTARNAELTAVSCELLAQLQGPLSQLRAINLPN
ncbi:hypothetical protein K0504_07720 [Neiella marina]|uniref:Uncharacterized protein n=1 Tax=Neiella holothuriorum TaxID=2870530 RepID=A0ABS7EF16_9GAMM|nr:hypothetical protein [Neiella holothuriorum]MBW8190921.1 hypothetical protein [Neiella holothuriorum]